ncbi:MAG: sugar phosphate nucleotidyltransferase, partial [Candidatus Theseobacter exili]|nr:sugar phosphate nucleotidyltransferase [Candidatus Theseobacter exili]
EAPEMGLLKVDQSGNIKEFVEKPKDSSVIERFKAPDSLFGTQKRTNNPDLCLASMGVYVFKPNVLEKVLSDRDKTDFGKEIIPLSIHKYKVMAYPFLDYWKDIGTIAAFFEANIDLAQPQPPFRLYEPKWPIYTHQRSLPPSRVIHSEIRDSLLVEGSDIDGAHIEDSIIGVRSIVRKNTHLKEVVMMGADFYEGEQVLGVRKSSARNTPPLGIGKNCMIRRAIIDKNVCIGDDVIIRSKEGMKDSKGKTHWIRDGITIIPKGTVIPSGTVI